MPINKARCIRYKDTWAAPGSALHQALTDGNKKAAEKIYNECERRLAKEQGGRTNFAVDDTLMVAETGNRPVFDDADE